MIVQTLADHIYDGDENEQERKDRGIGDRREIDVPYICGYETDMAQKERYAAHNEEMRAFSEKENVTGPAEEKGREDILVRIGNSKIISDHHKRKQRPFGQLSDTTVACVCSVKMDDADYQQYYK
jgi:hypothetical protein